MMPFIFSLGFALAPLVAYAQSFGNFTNEPKHSVISYVLPLIGMIFSFLLVKYREAIGDIIGEAEWMRKIGGVYYVIVYAALLIFFWSLAELTGTTDLLLKPIMFILPFPNNQTDF